MRALHHQTEDTRTYPCRACGGELEFHIGEQRLVCPHCGNQQDVAENEAGTVEEQDYRAALAALRDGTAGRAVTPRAEEMEVVCQNCGGHTTFEGTLTATRCPYCATPIQRDDVHEASARLAVDGILPFQVDERSARKAVRRWTRTRWLAPREFKKYNRASSFSSVYMAYFTYDADTRTAYEGQRGTNYTVTVGSGDNRRTETRTRWRSVAGQVSNRFDDILVHANEGLRSRHVAGLEPWPLAQVEPYSAEYVAGHLCRTYDRDVERCFGDAEEVIEREVTKTVKRDIGGDKQRIDAKRTSYRRLTYKHLLLPLWLLTVVFAGQAYQVVVNGATGEVKGERPWSKVKIALLVLAVLVVAAVAVAIYATSSG